EVVTVDQKVAVFHFTLCGSLYSARAFHEPVQEKIVGHQTDISKWVVGFELDQFLGCLEPDFVFAGAVGNPPASEGSRITVTRIGLSPRLESLLALFQVSG